MINVKKDWLQTVEFVDYNNFPWSRFKIDTGAQCNIISTEMCRKLGITDIKSLRFNSSAMIEENLNISDNRLEDIKNETVKDIEQQEVLKYIRNGWPNNKSEVSESAKPYLTFNDELSEINGIIYTGNCIVVPNSRRK
nr:uncharacterized protein LOC118679884 [Bactrocera oleae]